MKKTTNLTTPTTPTTPSPAAVAKKVMRLAEALAKKAAIAWRKAELAADAARDLEALKAQALAAEALAAQAREAARDLAYAERDAAYAARDLEALSALFKIFWDEEDEMNLQFMIEDIDPNYFRREWADYYAQRGWND